MQRTILSAGLMVLGYGLGCGAAFGQASPSFEVASVKPAEPPAAGQGGAFRVMMRGGPGTPDPGQLTYSNVSLKNVIQNAYDVKGYQITGPKWLDSERFDITAKIPKGTTKDEFKLMLQNLLAERFKLALHRETKNLPIFGLVVAKGGPKLKESVDDTPAPAAAATPGGPSPNAPSAFAPPPPPASDGGSGPRMALGDPSAIKDKVSVGSDGQIKMPGGMPKGAMMMMMSAGRMHLVGNGQPVSRLVETLSSQLGRPVVDETGLTGKYDFDLDFSPEEMMVGPMGMMPPPPPDHSGGGARSAGGPFGSAGSQPGHGGQGAAWAAIGLQERPGGYAGHRPARKGPDRELVPGAEMPF